MSWDQWPFYPKSLTEMIGPEQDAKDREEFVSLLTSGCSERLGRPLTILEPELDETGEPKREPDPDNPGQTRLALRRIDQINPREHFAKFCEFLRELPGQDEACQRCDENIAQLVIQTAVEDPNQLGEFSQGFPCHRHLIDQSGAIRFHRTPVAVAFSGQFLPDDEQARQVITDVVDNLVIENELSEEQWQTLYDFVDELETRDKFLDQRLRELRQHNPGAAVAMERRKPTMQELFLDEVKEIQQIACAQFQMHKRNRESEFRHDLREMFPALPIDSRNMIADEVQPVMEEVRCFCGTEYLALFISPQQHISYERNSNLLPPFVFAGIDEKTRSSISHLNWRKAGLMFATRNIGEEADTNLTAPIPVSITEQEAVQKALENGLKGPGREFFMDATILCQIYLSGAYRAALIWGPFPHLTASDLEYESRFIEEVSELAMMRVLSLVQLSDSESRTAAWEDVAGLLGHYSRRAMTPVSTGVRIIANHLQTGATYSKEDALEACDSLQVASRFISQAVRAPLFSFAAMVEEVYEFVPTSLDAIVRDCVRLYQPTASNKMVTIEVEQSLAELSMAEVDGVKMRDAIGYVLDNAIKYSHKDKVVRIKSELSGNRVRLTIEDFGQGIEENDLHLIFGRGYQGQRSRKALYEEGEGMGLFHARLIVEAQKGSIWAGCQSGGRSETSARLEGYLVWFNIELPIKQSDT